MTAELQRLAETLARGQRLMGLDVGKKTVGLALSDTTLSVASPLETIRRTKFARDAERLKELTDMHGVGGLVIGLPINMDGTEGPRCQGVRQFARNLEERLPLPVAFWDERLSTAAMERDLIALDTSRAKRAAKIDEMAAAFILQGAIDRIRGIGT